MGRSIGAVLLVLLLMSVSYAEKNPLIGMWLAQGAEQKAPSSDPMVGVVAGFSPKTIIFTEKSMESNGQLQRVEYEISGNEVVVWIEKQGIRFVVSGQTMKMQLPNPLTGKTSNVTYVRTTKEQAALAAKRAEDQGKAKATEASRTRQQEAMAELQGRWYAQTVEENGARTYELFSIRKSDQKEEVVFIIRGDQLFSLKDGQLTPFFAFTVNPSPDRKTVDPMFFDAKHIDAKFAEGQMKGQSSLGLYRLGHLLGDELLGICLAKPGDRNRPRSLETTRGDGRLCLNLVRSDQPADVAPTVSQPAPNSGAPDIRYLADLPSSAHVLEGVKGKDALDTVARQAGALDVLANAVKARTGGRIYRNELMPEESEKLGSYHAKLAKLIEEQQGKFDPVCTGMECPRAKWFGQYNKYAFSKEYKQEVFDLFLPKPWQAEHRQFDKN